MHTIERLSLVTFFFNPHSWQLNHAKFLLAFDFEDDCGKAIILRCHISVLAFGVLCLWEGYREGSIDNHRTDGVQVFPIYVFWYESEEIQLCQSGGQKLIFNNTSHPHGQMVFPGAGNMYTYYKSWPNNKAIPTRFYVSRTNSCQHLTRVAGLKKKNN